MTVKEAWQNTMRPGLLKRLSGGRGGRAAFILVGAHLGALLVTLVALFLIWLAGMSSILTEVHWIPAVLGTLVWLSVTFVLLHAFGFWGTVSSGGRDGGDQIEAQFAPRVAFRLGWLRWLVQLIAIGVSGTAMLVIWADMRWHHVIPTPEMEGLPDRMATMPVPRDWSRYDAHRTDDSFPADFYGYEVDYYVPESYRFAALKKWMSSPGWGTSFGDLQNIECDAVTDTCEAEVAPSEGGNVVYYVEAWYQTTSIEDLPPVVRLKLRYWISDVAA